MTPDPSAESSAAQTTARSAPACVAYPDAPLAAPLASPPLAHPQATSSATIGGAGHDAEWPDADPRPTLLLHCQHSLGIGHLTRSFALVAALTPHFRVVFLNGGRLPEGVRVPPDMRRIDLPPLGMDDGHTVVSRDAGLDVQAARAQRAALIDAAVQQHRPALLLVELFPFGRKKFAAEILALIRAARRARPGVRIACSVRDILVDARPDQQRHDDRARWWCDRYFDEVLVHADPSLARLGDSFRPSRPLKTPVTHTGYVLPQRAEPAEPSARGGHLLVSAGGGIVGARLYRAVLAARACMAAPPPLRIVAGPFLPEADWQALLAQTAGDPAIELRRHVPDLVAELRQARASISQCGYNSSMDLLVAGTPALVVPYATATENEQAERARRLAERGAWLTLDADVADDPQRMAEAIERLMTHRMAAPALALDGARRSAERLQALVTQAPGDAPARAPALRTGAADCPVLQALDARDARDGPQPVWIRDDDAGWADAELLALLDGVLGAGQPIDLAVIPTALTPDLARKLRQLPESVGQHQHGFSHTSHEPEGSAWRRCEFGPARPLAALRADLRSGQARLKAQLDGRLDDLFTPPWNRVAPEVPALLAELGYAGLSRDAGAPAQQALPELPVHTDFSRCWREGGGDAVAAHLAKQMRMHQGVGLMLHHAVMDAGQRLWLSKALSRWIAHPRWRGVRMRDGMAMGAGIRCGVTPQPSSRVAA